LAAAWHGHPVAGMKVRKSKRERSEMADNSRRMRRRLLGVACVRVVSGLARRREPWT
jgi:hypothetical protein